MMGKRVAQWLIARILHRYHGRLFLPDGTIVVRQSAAFNAWCYGAGYQAWEAETEVTP